MKAEAGRGAHSCTCVFVCHPPSPYPAGTCTPVARRPSPRPPRGRGGPAGDGMVYLVVDAGPEARDAPDTAHTPPLLV